MTRGIVLLALLLRLPFITESLWLDEAIEAIALQGYYGPLLSYAVSDFQPPFYHFLLKAWTNLAGYSELALRTPSLMAGAALTYVSIKLGELLHTRRTGLILGLLVATNPLLIYYSQEGRTYILTTLLVTTSFYFLAHLLKNKHPSKRSLLYYLLSSAAAIWTSYLAWFVILLQLMYLLYLRRFVLARLTLLSMLTITPWLPSFIRSLGLGLDDAAASPEWGKVVGGISIKALTLTWVKAAIGRISFTPAWLYGGVILTVAAVHALILRGIRQINSLMYIWLGALLPAALISFFVPAYSYTRVLFVVPAYLLLLALGGSRHKSNVGVTMIITAQLACLAIYWLSPRFHRENWRDLTAYVNAGDGAIAIPSRDQLPPLIYYGLARRVFEPGSEVLPQDKTIYYIRYAEDIFDPNKTGQANLGTAGYTIQKEVSFTGISLVIYENRD